MLSSSSDSLCINNTQRRVPVLFGLNMRSGCFIRYSLMCDFFLRKNCMKARAVRERKLCCIVALWWVSCGQFSPSVRPHNPATRFRPPSATVVSAEPFSHGTGTLRCLQKEMATYRHWCVSLWRDPDCRIPHCRILSPDKTEWRLILATLCGWRRCFVADQLQFMTHTRRRRLTDTKHHAASLRKQSYLWVVHQRLESRDV